MPYCTSCGAPVDSRARFCGRCGSRQTAADSGGVQAHEFLSEMSDRTACILCYVPVFGIIPSILFLATQRFRTNYRVRFNAFQGLYLFVAWLILSSAIPTILPGFGAARGFQDLANLALIACWIYLLVKAARDQEVKLPIVGDLAVRSTQEQV